MHGQIHGLFVFYKSHSQHLVRCIPYEILFPFHCFGYLAVFFTWVSYLTPKFGAHDRKMSLQKFPRMTKKG